MYNLNLPSSKCTALFVDQPQKPENTTGQAQTGSTRYVFVRGLSDVLDRHGLLLFRSRFFNCISHRVMNGLFTGRSLSRCAYVTTGSTTPPQNKLRQVFRNLLGITRYRVHFRYVIYEVIAVMFYPLL
jgi:hypothetical protein